MVNVSWLGRGAINLTQQIERSRRLAVEEKKATKGGWHVVQADVVRSGGGDIRYMCTWFALERMLFAENDTRRISFAFSAALAPSPIAWIRCPSGEYCVYPLAFATLPSPPKFHFNIF